MRSAGGIALALALAACGDDAGAGGSGEGGGASGTSSSSTSSGAPATCDFANDASVVQEAEQQGTAPTAQGGTIADGTYHLTSEVRYVSMPPDPPDEDIRETLVVSGASWRRLRADGADVAAGTPSCVVWAVTTSGTALSIEAEGAGALEGFTYTATPASLQVISGDVVMSYAMP